MKIYFCPFAPRFARCLKNEANTSVRDKIRLSCCPCRIRWNLEHTFLDLRRKTHDVCANYHFVHVMHKIELTVELFSGFWRTTLQLAFAYFVMQTKFLCILERATETEEFVMS